MTKAELLVIEERAKAASPGPWKGGSEYEQSDPGHYVAASNDAIVCASQDGTDCPLREVDRDFIVAARSDVPALIAEVRRLRDQVLYLRRMMWVMAAASTVAALASIISRL